ncbi:protein-glutamate O-methyltransferase CheR [Marivirga sp. S37H4]|uniref:protein-glutamate O-methyltransferase n=1 Tax=Marivirga aurantiaca TaxID=2802615 RepID=A0A935CBS6_9BACT|nr:protein-glutamate O-methyltransferase CheR [Marivirga aurantiaca]MBK6267249.1 protein-glutamate O-methyltransferase CheR [Marivirga aurantiaca]
MSIENDFTPTINITDEEMRSIQDAIMQRYGIDFHNYEPKSFKRRIQRIYRKFGFQSSFDLWSRALKDKDFVHDFINEVSVGLTSLFRNPEFWQTFKTLCELQFSKTYPLHVWHAGCSSGEEIYTTAIVWDELGYTRRVKSLATDISSSALEQAQSGKINRAKLPEYERNLKSYNPKISLSQYFSETEKEVTFKPEHLRHVTFRNSNLIMEDYGNEQYNIIFCRNVLIYFDGPAKAKVIEKIYQSLKPGGFLIVGFLDSMLSYLDESKFEYFDLSNRIFRKL